MKNKTIIIVFLVVIIVMSGGYFYYNYQQKVSMAEYYYSIGDYQKASNMNIGEVSKKALALFNASKWEKDKKDSESLYTDILLINAEKKINKNDENFNSSINVYYKEIANYLGGNTDTLDNILKTGYQKGQVTILELIKNKN